MTGLNFGETSAGVQRAAAYATAWAAHPAGPRYLVLAAEGAELRTAIFDRNGRQLDAVNCSAEAHELRATVARWTERNAA